MSRATTMLRRAAGLALAVVGGLAIFRAAAVVAIPSLRLAVVTLLAGGLLLCLVGLVRRQLDLRPLIRGVALAIPLVFAGGVLVLYYRLVTRIIPMVGDADMQLRVYLTDAGHGLPWLAGALLYFGLAIVLLPGRGQRPARDPAAPAAPDAGKK